MELNFNFHSGVTSIGLHTKFISQLIQDASNGSQFSKKLQHPSRFLSETNGYSRILVDVYLRGKYELSDNKRKEISEALQTEPLLMVEADDETSPFKITHRDLWDLYKKAEASYWTADEIDLGHDVKDWETMSSNEKHFIGHILAFLAPSGRIVNGKLAMDFCYEVKCSEARCFYGFQMAIENVHSEVYSLLIDTYIKDVTERSNIINAIETVPCVQKRVKWTMKWCDRNNTTFSERIVAFAAVEGIFHRGFSCSIFWLKKRGLMPGLSFSNELISRDEGMHCDFACLIYNKLVNSLPQSRIFEIIGDAVKIETEFVRDALPVELIGMNSGLMTQYIQFCADRLLVALGCEKLYKVTNPYFWMTVPDAKLFLLPNTVYSQDVNIRWGFYKRTYPPESSKVLFIVSVLIESTHDIGTGSLEFGNKVRFISNANSLCWFNKLTISPNALKEHQENECLSKTKVLLIENSGHIGANFDSRSIYISNVPPLKLSWSQGGWRLDISHLESIFHTLQEYLRISRLEKWLAGKFCIQLTNIFSLGDLTMETIGRQF
eukprot:gene8826-18272_t